MERLSEPSLHLWTRRTLYCLASCHCDVAILSWGGMITFASLVATFGWEGCCNAMQMQMTNLKLHALGLWRTARVCEVLACMMACGWLLFFVIVVKLKIFGEKLHNTSKAVQLALMLSFAIGFACTLAGLLIQFLGLCVAAGKALSFGWHDAGIRHAACLLYVNSLLQLLSPIISWRATFESIASHRNVEPSGIVLLTLDISLQVLNVLLLSGRAPSSGRTPWLPFRGSRTSRVSASPQGASPSPGA